MDANPSSTYEKTILEVMSEAPTIHPNKETSKYESQATKGQVGNNEPNMPDLDNCICMLCLLNPYIGCPKGDLLKLELKMDTLVYKTKMTTRNACMNRG